MSNAPQLETLSPKYDPAAVEARWYPIWEEKGYFRPEVNPDAPAFTIVIPPPNVTGSLHMGHAMYVLEDVMIRHHRMRGENTLWLPGTDHAGIATQVVVERLLRRQGITRHDLGREKFIEEVWKWKQQSGNRIYEQLRVLGFSLDWSRERFTMDPGCSRAVRLVFVSLYRDGLLYRDTRLINWCSRCATALSDLEVEDEKIKGSLWHIAYPVKGSEKRLVVATTRPETMLGDTAVAIHPEDPRFRDLLGQKALLPLTDREIPIIGDAILVDPEFGTGAVKVTPGHDFNDYETGKRHNLPIISILDKAGKLNENAPAKYQGLTVAEARKAVLNDLEAQGLLLETKPHELTLPVCQRCGTVVEPMISTQWFVRTKPLARPAIAAVENGFTKIYPEGWDKTYYHWMRNIQDWCVSRQLWWGHQIPAWYGPDGAIFVEENEEAAKEAAKAHYGAEEVLILSQKEAEAHSRLHDPKKVVALYRDEDVLDTWFSSALWPFSTLGWPEKTQDLKTFYPNSVLETGFDILFFWVARMMMMGIYCMGEVPFRAVYLHGMVRDDEGQKMSKVKGNVIDPLDVVYGISKEDLVEKSAAGAPSEKEEEKIRKKVAKKFPEGIPPLGVDALRFALIIQATAGRDIKFDVARVQEYRTFANKIWNAARFGLMNLEGFSPESFSWNPKEASIYDRWLRHRLGQVSQEIDQKLSAMEFADAAQTIYHFFWHELCDWYIELAKSALSSKENPKARAQAQGTVSLGLDVALRLLHPFMPFVTEEIWQKLPRLPEAQGGSASAPSIMVAPFPRAGAGLTEATPEDEAAVSEYQLIRDTVLALRNLRGELSIPDNKSLGAAYVRGAASSIALLQRELSAWQRLAGITALLPEEERPKGPTAGALVLHPMGNVDISILLTGLVDLEAEEARLKKAEEKTQKELQKIRKKLENDSFVKSAPAEVVAREREKEAEEAAKLASITQKLQKIQSLRQSS